MQQSLPGMRSPAVRLGLRLRPQGHFLCPCQCQPRWVHLHGLLRWIGTLQPRSLGPTDLLSILVRSKHRLFGWTMAAADLTSLLLAVAMVQDSQAVVVPEELSNLG